jgi:hypothetical protein
MRPGEFWEAMDAHSKEKEADRRHAGELARGASLRIFNALVTAKSRIADPAEFWRMPWDEAKIDEGLEYLQSLTQDERAEEAREFINRIGW